MRKRPSPVTPIPTPRRTPRHLFLLHRLRSRPTSPRVDVRVTRRHTDRLFDRLTPDRKRFWQQKSRRQSIASTKVRTPANRRKQKKPKRRLATRQRRRQRWYRDGDIRRLLEFYLPHDQLRSYVFAPLQGNGRFVSSGALRQNIETRLREMGLFEENDNGNGGITLILPLNLNRNHWVLVRLHFTSSRLSVDYGDPLGRRIPSSLRSEFELLSSNSNPPLNFGLTQLFTRRGRLQNDGFNCGPWIVEIARCLFDSTRERLTRDFDITQARREHERWLRIVREAEEVDHHEAEVALTGRKRRRQKEEGEGDDDDDGPKRKRRRRR